MSYSGFSKLQSDDVAEDATNTLPRTKSRRGRAFTPFELGLIITLILFAVALATYTIVYTVQHHGAIRPAAIAALSCVALLLLLVAFSIYQRIRRPNWFRDVESGEVKTNKWVISAPIPMSQTFKSEDTFGSKTTYTSLAKTRLQKRDPSVSDRKKSPHTFKFWTSKNASADKEYEHLISGSERSSAEMSERSQHLEPSKRPLSLWRSVFELPGEAEPAATPELPAGDVQIVVTRPEPTAGRQQSLRRGRSIDLSTLRHNQIAIDPLRSNPFRELRRDSSVRLTKSSHTLGRRAEGHHQDEDNSALKLTAPPSSQRARSAEPAGSSRRPDTARLLGHDLAEIQAKIDRAVADTEAFTERTGRVVPAKASPDLRTLQQQQQQSSRSRSTSPRVSPSLAVAASSQGRHNNNLQQTQQKGHPRALRRAKSPVVGGGAEMDGPTGQQLAADLRKAYMLNADSDEVGR